ncbi:MAG: phosphatidylinositol dimannoside acyltransferase [Actinomycetota bacterium]|nr:phosphatidylinositol dimannoside acyltransferase [Actinomycetota bacterium]
MPILPKRTPYLAYRAGAEIARLVPEPVGAPVARGLAQVAPAVLSARRHQVERNLRRIHGPQFSGWELRRAVTATFDSYGRYFYELFRLPTYEPAWIEDHFRCLGIEHVADAVAAGTGAVLALPHLGNWDFAGAWLALQGYAVTVVAEPVEPPELFEWFVATRAQLGMRVVPLSPSAGTEVLKAVRNNEVVCLLSDRDLTGDGVEVEFFGERTTLPGGPAMIALRGRAPLLPAGCYFRARGRHETHILPPVPSERAGRIREDLGRVTQALAHRFEDLIRVAPTHWHLLQPNWPSDRT